MDNREPRRRAVTPEWAAHVSDDLADIKHHLARLLAHHGIGDGQLPLTHTHDPERGHFAPGTGWYPDTPPQPEPPAPDDIAAASIAQARAILKPTDDEAEAEQVRIAAQNAAWRLTRRGWGG